MLNYKKHRKLKFWISYLIKLMSIYFLYFNVTYAGLSDDLHNYFDHLIDNPSASSTYAAQAAGYYGGGEIVKKNDIRDLQIMHVDLPNFSSGCGGIDLFKGGFSMINSQDLVEFFKATLSNAAGYSFTLAMESATPEIANVMKYLKDMADKINQTNFNSCEMAEGLVGSLWSQVHDADRHTCAAIKNTGGDTADYAAARQACGVGGKLNETLQNPSGDKAVYKQLVAYKVNVAWRAAQQSSILFNNRELAELAMALTGTIIFRSEGAAAYVVLAPIASVDEIAHALLYGGSIKVYSCADDACLAPDTSSITVNDGLVAKIIPLLDELKNSVLSGNEPSTRAKGLLQATSLPVLAMIKAKINLTQDNTALNFASYADIIASDILFQYLQGILSALRAGSNGLQLPEAVLEKMQKNIAVATDLIYEKQRATYSQFELVQQMINQAETSERNLEDDLARRIKGK